MCWSDAISRPPGAYVHMDVPIGIWATEADFIACLWVSAAAVDWARQFASHPVHAAKRVRNVFTPQSELDAPRPDVKLNMASCASRSQSDVGPMTRRAKRTVRSARPLTGKREARA